MGLYKDLFLNNIGIKLHIRDKDLWSGPKAQLSYHSIPVGLGMITHTMRIIPHVNGLYPVVYPNR
ncbi:hypothetical protein D3C85_1428140 [compost metagenome]